MRKQTLVVESKGRTRLRKMLLWQQYFKIND